MLTEQLIISVQFGAWFGLRDLGSLSESPLSLSCGGRSWMLWLHLYHSWSLGVCARGAGTVVRVGAVCH